MSGPPVDERTRAHLVAEHDVLPHAEVRAEVDLLVDGADPGVLRGARVAEALVPAVDDDPAGVDPVDAGERLDEGRLPRAVLPRRACTSPGSSRKLTSSSALTPGNVMVMPVIS